MTTSLSILSVLLLSALLMDLLLIRCMVGSVMGCCIPVDRCSCKRRAFPESDVDVPDCGSKQTAPGVLNRTSLICTGHIDPEQFALRREVDRCRRNDCARQSIFTPVPVLVQVTNVWCCPKCLPLSHAVAAPA